MIKYKYYKFPNKESVPADNIWPFGVSVHEIGLIPKTAAKYGADGKAIELPTYYEGWHINVCYQGQVNLDFVKQYEIEVNNPKCTWMGQTT
jgi:hypothetical protein